ncbi:MAG: YicC/YloC family endoribonuclease [Peptostreptococcales bacterium]
MIKSMTGFGRSEYCDGVRNVIVEIKSINHRYNDISIRIPKKYSFAEERVKAEVKSIIKRGKIDISVIVENIVESDYNVSLNTDIVKQYMDNLSLLKEEFHLQDEITLHMLINLPDVLKLKPQIKDEEAFLETILIPTKEACEKLDQMRRIEGEKLGEDIIARTLLIKDYIEKVEERSPNMVKEYREKIKERINEILEDGISISEERLATEVALFADRCSITEEIVRLHSHGVQLSKNVEKSTEPCGRKLDFIIQEMNREANTIGSKANDLEITNVVVDIKSEIEKIREQVQNIE